MIIHTRNCPQLTVTELQKTKINAFVIHCFSEDLNFATKIFDMGETTKISFTGIITYPQSNNIKEVAKKAPIHRIMIETDAPYLIPE